MKNSKITIENSHNSKNPPCYCETLKDSSKKAQWNQSNGVKNSVYKFRWRENREKMEKDMRKMMK